MAHGAVEGGLNSFTYTRGAALRQLDFVNSLVNAEGNHFGFRKPLPAALVVEEVDEVELLVGPVLHLLSDPEDVQGGQRQGHPVVETARPLRLGVYDLLQF